jgi:hypothetical protein
VEHWGRPNIEYAGKTRAGNVATSLAVPARWIGRVNGPDRADLGHFAKKVLDI